MGQKGRKAQIHLRKDPARLGTIFVFKNEKRIGILQGTNMKFMEGTCLLYKDLAIDELVKHGYIDGSCAKSLRSEYCQLKGKARYSILRLPLNSIATIRNPTKREKDFFAD